MVGSGCDWSRGFWGRGGLQLKSGLFRGTEMGSGGRSDFVRVVYLG